MRKKAAGDDDAVQYVLPLRPCWPLLMNLTIIRGKGSAERSLKRGMDRRDWGLTNKMKADQPRPDNLIPIIGLPGDLLVVFAAAKTEKTRQKSIKLCWCIFLH